MVDHMFYDNRPLCCCEYIDRGGERNHILACCCNCVELDNCCDRLLTCKPVRRTECRSVMWAIMDRMRCPGRGGAFLMPTSYATVSPFFLQPIIAITIVLVFHHAEVFISLIVCLQAFIAAYMAKHNARSQILFYWTVSASTYTMILFEMSVIPLLEIRWDENMVIVISCLIALGSFYLTKMNSGGPTLGDGANGALISNGVAAESVCPICRIKVYPRCVHCSVCQTCIPRFDRHCFWLDCCIGEGNQVFFFFGLIFGIFTLVYGSLLMLTTICRPAFKYQILVPTDCSDALEELELGLCYCAALYCVGMALLLLLALLENIWLVSRGISGGEWRQQKYSICTPNPYSRGCCRNWIYLLSGLKKLRR